jgi:hypothetical protein
VLIFVHGGAFTAGNKRGRNASPFHDNIMLWAVGTICRSSAWVKSCYIDHMKVEDIAEAVAKLPPGELARFRRWFSAFEAGRTDHADELNSTATKLGRFAGRALAELKKRTKDRES